MNRSAFVGALLVGAIAVSGGGFAADSTLYRLRPGASFQEGCFPPCMCPILMIEELRGSFVLRHRGADWLFDHYDVDAVRWRMRRFDGTVVPIRGSGRYLIGGEFALTHRLQLDLAVGDERPEAYDSGLIVVGAEFPRLDIAISLHGMYCYDRVFELRARPVPRLQFDSTTSLLWQISDGVKAFDLTWGSLEKLRDHGGDFSAAVGGCLAEDQPEGRLSLDFEPSPGEGIWILLREVGDAVEQTYDASDASQARPRDAMIDGSGRGCR